MIEYKTNWNSDRNDFKNWYWSYLFAFAWNFIMLYIVLALVDLQYHCHNFQHLKMVSRAMLQDLNRRFQHILQPSSDNFNPLPAAACLLDPTVAAVMLTDDVKDTGWRFGLVVTRWLRST